MGRAWARAAIDRRQGVNRIARALRWTDHLEDVARAATRARVSFDLLADTGHPLPRPSRGGLVARTFDSAQPLLGEPTGPMAR
jgi:hypothetical protein